MKIHRLPGAMMALALALLSFFPAGAAPSVRPTLLNLTYFVSPTGRDTNSGTQSSPFKTFAKALSVMSAGDTLTILPGTYAQQLKIAKSGTSSAGITVNGSGAIIDLLNGAAPGIIVTGSYVSVSGLEVKNIPGVCVDLRGSNVAVSGLTVHECQSHGISTANNSHVRILNSSIFRAVLSNSARTMTSGWGSGLKVRVSACAAPRTVSPAPRPSPRARARPRGSRASAVQPFPFPSSPASHPSAALAPHPFERMHPR